MRTVDPALLLAALLVSPAAAQTTWHVDVHATAPGDGSPASPYTSIQHALDQPTTQPGDKLLVAPGTYVENIGWGGASPVHIRASGGPHVTEIRPANPQVTTVALLGSTIEGFTLTGNDAPGLGGAALNLDAATAVHCIVRDNLQHAVVSFSAVLRECTIVDNGGGILVEHFYTVTLRNTILWYSGVVVPGSTPPQIDYCAGDLPPNAGTGNVHGNPGLWSFPGANPLLAPGSPCIDAGDPQSPLDPDGSPADIGAVPFDANFDPTPMVFCTAKPTSLGCVPAIGFQGHATVGGVAPFVVSASQVHPTAPGLLFYGPGAHFLPFQGAWHCVQFPTPRVGGQAAAGSGLCGGTYTYDFAAHLAAGAFDFVTPGATLACQWWSRDVADPLGFGTTLTDALLFSVVP